MQQGGGEAGSRRYVLCVRRAAIFVVMGLTRGLALSVSRWSGLLASSGGGGMRGGVADRHVHPAEPLAVRLTLAARF